MELTFNWTTAAMVSVPALLCWLAFALWRPQPIIEYVYDEATDDLVPFSDDLIHDDIAEMPHYVDRRTSAAAMDEAMRRVGEDADGQTFNAMYFVVLHEWGF